MDHFCLFSTTVTFSDCFYLCLYLSSFSWLFSFLSSISHYILHPNSFILGILIVFFSEYRWAFFLNFSSVFCQLYFISSCFISIYILFFKFLIWGIIYICKFVMKIGSFGSIQDCLIGVWKNRSIFQAWAFSPDAPQGSKWMN